MASPLFVIESATSHFLQQWNFGMCPRFSIDTNANGSITVNSAVTYLPPKLNLNNSDTNFNGKRRPPNGVEMVRENVVRENDPLKHLKIHQCEDP